MGKKRGKSRKIIIRHAGEYSESEARLNIIKHIMENKWRCSVPDECGRKEQDRYLRENKQG